SEPAPGAGEDAAAFDSATIPVDGGSWDAAPHTSDVGVDASSQPQAVDASGDASSEAELDAGSPDGGSTSDSGALAVGALEDRVIQIQQTLEPIPLTITGAAMADPTVTVASASLDAPSATQLPSTALTVTGSGLDRALVIGPIEASFAGRYSVTVLVDDGVSTASAAFTLRVNAPPALPLIADSATVVGFPIPPFSVVLYEDGPSPTTVELTAASSDPSVLSDDGIALGPIIDLGGGRGSFSITLTPNAAGVEGSCEVTLQARDDEGASSSQTFGVTIRATATNGVELVSRTSATPPASSNGLSLSPAVDGQGRHVVFSSTASDLAGGSPSAGDLFVRDRVAGTVTRLGVPGRTDAPTITPDGRFIAFVSLASSLAGTDTNQGADVFVYDRQTATFERASVASDGTPGNQPSSVDPSAGNGLRPPAISDDGRYVAFESEATNLVAGDTNGVADIFLRDRLTGTTTRISVSSSGAQANAPSTEVAMSGDGAVLAFESMATNLVDGETESDSHADVYVRAANSTSRASSTAGGAPGNGASTSPALDATGRHLAFASAATDLLTAPELYGKIDIYLLDRQAGTKTRINLDLNPQASQGHCGTPRLSAGGSRLVFRSDGIFPGYVNGLINGYAFDLPSSTLTFVGPSLALGAPNGGSGYGLNLSADGRVIVFQSSASNLFPGDTNGAIDVFLQELAEP
ncbi:MAG: PD40 domain-containing protein, partial [Deltaproteobacteria bacterium]|nr:PD40 domain-containing protein [Deltaproteobacteria bacterium]